MSIYATLWTIKVPRHHEFDEDWVEVYAQAVPPHIGHPSHYPDGDPYGDFLPPVVECDPKTGDGPVYRAVVIVFEERSEKLGQRYVSPLLTLTGADYASIPFDDLLRRIHKAIPWDPDVVGATTGPDGLQKVIRIPGIGKELEQ